MHILILIGLTIFLGTLSGKIFQKLKIPQVTGYIVVGFILGQSILKVLSYELVQQFTPFVNLALGIIGFMLGSELRFDLFRHKGRSIYSILFCQAFATFAIVAIAVTIFTKEVYIGILLGAIASATAPAATVDVLWEYKTRGPLTATLLAIVALDDVLALVLYGFASVIAKALITHQHMSIVHSFETPFIEIGGAVLIGTGSGFFLYRLTHFIRDRERILPFSFGIITLVVGLASFFKIDLILASMISGLTLSNIAPIESKEIFDAIKKFSAPIYILFFVLVGARLDISLVIGSGVTILLLIYLISRTFGKWIGSFVGGLVGKAQEDVTKFLGLGLLSQAGVAIGMAISINNNLSHVGPEAAQIGSLIVNITVATTFIFQLIGPFGVRFAVEKSGEMWKDVTEEDIIKSFSVADLIENDIPIIRENTPLDSMVELVKNSESYDFCVVDQNNRLLGSISIGDFRGILLEQEIGLHQLVMAKDIAVPCTRIIAAAKPLKEAIDILRRKDLDFLPVVKDEKTKEFLGLIHYKYVMAEIQKKLLKRRGS